MRRRARVRQTSVEQGLLFFRDRYVSPGKGLPDGVDQLKSLGDAGTGKTAMAAVDYGRLSKTLKRSRLGNVIARSHSVCAASASAGLGQRDAWPRATKQSPPTTTNPAGRA